MLGFFIYNQSNKYTLRFFELFWTKQNFQRAKIIWNIL